MSGQRGLRRDWLKRVMRVVETHPSTIVRAVLPAGTAAQHIRWFGASEIQVSDDVPACRVAGLARHLRSHGSDTLVDALGLVACDAACVSAAVWLALAAPVAATGA